MWKLWIAATITAACIAAAGCSGAQRPTSTTPTLASQVAKDRRVILKPPSMHFLSLNGKPRTLRVSNWDHIGPDPDTCAKKRIAGFYVVKWGVTWTTLTVHPSSKKGDCRAMFSGLYNRGRFFRVTVGK